MNFGVIGPDKYIEEERYVPDSAGAEIPASFSIKDFFTVPVWNQGNFPTCVGWSTAFCTSYLNRLDMDMSGLQTSPFMIYDNARKKGNISPTQGGAYLRDAVKVILDGSCEMHFYPGIGNSRPGWQQNGILYRAKEYMRCVDFDDVRLAISRGNPVLFSVAIYGTLQTNDTGGVELDEHRMINGKLRPIMGYHALVAVGYDKDMLLVRNSWGHNYGKNGYCRMSKQYFNLALRDAYVVIDQPFNVPTVPTKKKSWIARIFEAIKNIFRR